MGYTHYWPLNNWITLENRHIWAQLIFDTRRIIKAAKEHGIKLCGDDDSSRPRASIRNGIVINGPDGEGCECFDMNILYSRGYCETMCRDYDRVVCCVLLRAYNLAPECIEISSGGNWNGEYEPWELAREFYARLWPEETLQKPPGIRG